MLLLYPLPLFGWFPSLLFTTHLKTCDVLQILVPILYHLNDARADCSRVGLVHIGVFILLLLSGERNFGVRLNRPSLATAPMDLTIFSGTHADLLVVVFHKLITTGHTRLQPLFDCLLTILVNVSPYLKTLSMVAAAKVLHLLEAFSTPWFLFSNPSNHHLVFFLLEIFNNIIQYQFDGNANLMYTIIKKRHAFHALANLPTDYGAIQRSLSSATNAASSASSASAGSLRRASSSRVGGHSRKQPHRPHSLIERASSQPPEHDIVLVPQVEKMCIEKGITDENEILRFLQHGTLVGLLLVPHPILICKYKTNVGTTIWFRTYMWGVIYLRNSDPPIWYDTNVRLFEIQKN
ncbi:cell wall biogenesis protein [Tyrophagus putrescentiae]|nr:cell wall biogenesis protein [Tyrophagus putrescentiae]